MTDYNPKVLSNAQKELLKLFETDLSEPELIELRQLLGSYYGKKAIQEANKHWDDNHFSDDLMKKWLNES